MPYRGIPHRPRSHDSQAARGLAIFCAFFGPREQAVNFSRYLFGRKSPVSPVVGARHVGRESGSARAMLAASLVRPTRVASASDDLLVARVQREPKWELFASSICGRRSLRSGAGF
jgi:hypothetical protein